MARPAKPFSVIESERKSHRTKAELNQRKQEEAKLLSGQAMKENPSVRKNPAAHKEFNRIRKLLKNIEKNDALYEAIINRYCLMVAECQDLENRREEFYELIHLLHDECKEFIENAEEDEEEKKFYMLEYGKSIAKMMSSMMACDKQIQAKRKMLLEIEKECVMTIASSLRSIPKKVDEGDDPLLKILRGG